MRLSTSAAVAVLAFSSHIVAEGHNEHGARGIQHQHHHARQAKAERRDVAFDKRAVEIVTEYQFVTVDQDGVPWETQAAFIQEAEVLHTSAAALAPAPSSSSAPVSTPESSSVQAASKPYTSAASTSDSHRTSSSSDGGVDVPFPDGTIPCSQFPSNYGAVPLNYLGNNGWTGIQLNNGDVTDCSADGALCSYACPPGYSKSQWPDNQPADGQSRGGLLCQGGILHLTRPSSNTLCIAGHGSANLVNNMSSNVAVCRTDYPGTENMVIPVSPGPGTTLPLTVVDSATYYTWGGKQTSAQYYVNKAGVAPENGCIWGTPEAGVGNYAPLVFGAGFKDGVSWISMFPNPLANGADAGYNVAIVAADGSTINGGCTYVNGQFSTAGGCTVAVTSGSANFVFTNRN